jgi:hypothetical protein
VEINGRRAGGNGNFEVIEMNWNMRPPADKMQTACIVLFLFCLTCPPTNGIGDIALNWIAVSALIMLILTGMVR